MKTKLLLLLMALSMGAYAQGNLQFNQVLTYAVNTTQTNIYTVPSDKVAKITKAIEKNDTSNYHGKFTINGTTQPQSESGAFDHKGGAWLKAGDTIGSDIGFINDDHIFISIIEYNIISP